MVVNNYYLHHLSCTMYVMYLNNDRFSKNNPLPEKDSKWADINLVQCRECHIKILLFEKNKSFYVAAFSLISTKSMFTWFSMKVRSYRPQIFKKTYVTYVSQNSAIKIQHDENTATDSFFSYSSMIFSHFYSLPRKFSQSTIYLSNLRNNLPQSQDQ